MSRVARNGSWRRWASRGSPRMRGTHLIPWSVDRAPPAWICIYQLSSVPLGEKEPFTPLSLSLIILNQAVMETNPKLISEGCGKGEAEGKQIHLLSTETRAGLGPELQRAILSRLSQFLQTFKSSSDKNPTIHCYINGFSTICR